MTQSTLPCLEGGSLVPLVERVFRVLVHTARVSSPSLRRDCGPAAGLGVLPAACARRVCVGCVWLLDGVLCWLLEALSWRLLQCVL